MKFKMFIKSKQCCILCPGRAIARIFVKTGGGTLASAEGTNLLGGSGVLPQKIFTRGGSETLFSALVMRHVSEKSTSNKCEKAGGFSAYNIISEVLLI